MKRLLLAVVTGVLVLSAGAIRSSAQVEPLAFFKNYFITGDYVVGGVGLSGSGRGDISIQGVPAGTDIAAAFLYWQVVDKSNLGPDAGGLGVTFRGHPLNSVNGSFGKLLAGATPGCSSGGGGASGSNRTYSYRADVLRYLDVEPQGGKLSANGRHAVTLPNGQGLEALGASLVVVFRDPTAPLSAIVLYDGAHTMSQTTGEMRQSIQGFYDAGTSAKLTHIVGSGQSNSTETLRYNGQALAVDPFQSSRSAQWDNPTFSVDALVNPALQKVTTSVDHQGFSSYGCFTWSAIVYRTTVKDFDQDGLLDRWEESPEPILDPYGHALPNLAAMGAHKEVKDVFIEVGYMKADAPTVYGPIGSAAKPAHTHLPGHEALKLMGDAFAAAPTPINVHFDVGNNYPPGLADPYIIRNTALDNGLARGGEGMNESVTQCAPGANVWECQFSLYPGTVGWKSGFRFLRDEVLNPVPVPAGQDDPCDAPGATCERRFDRNRTHMFRYALFAHALGLPESEKACLVNGVPADDVNGSCAAIGVDNPAFHKPRTNTGIADFPGSDILITLGGFNDLFGRPVGTPFMQASTLMHEFGHNAERRHGGEALEQNCKPTYLSAMNYLYQLRGLLDDRGRPNLDFARGIGSTVNENGLSALNYQPYRLGWYAPLASSYLAGRSAPARRHCNGSDLLPTDLPMVRIDARTRDAAIDWDADGSVATSAASQDVNFNGRLDGPPSFAALGGSDDWSNLRLNQIGSRRNVGGIFVDPATGATVVGPLSLDSGKGDLGKGDLGKGDLGKGDLGKGDLGKGDLGKGDLGKGDLGKGDLGKGDLGGGDLFLNDPNNPSGELDATTAGDLAKAAPIEFAACVTGENCPATVTGALHDVYVRFGAPNEGNADFFTIYRVEGAELTFAPVGQPQQTWTAVEVLDSVPGQDTYSTFDDDELVDGATYTYFIVATYLDGVTSDPSNLVTIVGRNDPAVAVDDSYSTDEDTVLTVPANGVLANDGDPDSQLTLTAQVAVAPVHGTLTLNADGSFVYTPQANYHGTDSFTYNATSGAIVLGATVTITVNPVNDVPTAVGNSYAADEDTALSVGAPGVLAGDADADGDALTATLAAGPSHGTLILNANGSFTYTPAANYAGADSFTYRASDGTALSPVVTVDITVGPVNDAPAANGQTVQTNEDTPRAIVLTASDVDSGTLTYRVASGPTHGTLSGTAPTLTYTPAANYHGPDAFTFVARDGAVDSTIATVSINVTSVNDAPTISNLGNVTIDADTGTAPLAFTIGDVDGLAGLSVSGTSSNATLVPAATIGFGGSDANRTVTVTPAANQSGTATITVTVTDAGGLSASDTFILTVVRVEYALVGQQNVPPATITRAKAGSAVPMKWQFKRNGVVVNSAHLNHTITVTGPYPSGPVSIRTVSNTDAGSSSFRYSALDNSWSFNLQTKDPNGVAFPVGGYDVVITPSNDPRYLPVGPFRLTLTK